MKPDARALINFGGFPLAWFACVYGGASDLALAGTLVALAAVVMHLAIRALFATTLNLSMAWLKRPTWLAVLMGAAGGPLAYFAGHRLGGVEIPDPAMALLAQALGWAALMPTLARIAEHLNGFAPPPVARTWSFEP